MTVHEAREVGRFARWRQHGHRVWLLPKRLLGFPLGFGVGHADIAQEIWTVSAKSPPLATALDPTSHPANRGSPAAVAMARQRRDARNRVDVIERSDRW
jgi:hypothetical protein